MEHATYFISAYLLIIYSHSMFSLPIINRARIANHCAPLQQQKGQSAAATAPPPAADAQSAPAPAASLRHRPSPTPSSDVGWRTSSVVVGRHRPGRRLRHGRNDDHPELSIRRTVRRRNAIVSWSPPFSGGHQSSVAKRNVVHGGAHGRLRARVVDGKSACRRHAGCLRQSGDEVSFEEMIKSLVC